MLSDDAHEPNHPLPDLDRSARALPGLRRGHLFRGFLSVRPACEVCGQDFSRFDSADGPAFFVMSITGFVVAGTALWLEFTYEPPVGSTPSSPARWRSV